MAAASGIRAGGRPSKSRSSTTDGTRGLGIAPAGASRGTREAVELRDGGRASAASTCSRRWRGIESEIAPALRRPRCDATRPASTRCSIALDGTPNKARLGGNALIATSLAVLHAAAAHARLPLWQYLAQGRAGAAAAAADPDLRRRRACRAPRRRAGLHGDRHRRAAFARGAGDDGRGLPRGRRADGASADRWPASPTKAAGGRTSRATRRRWTRWWRHRAAGFMPGDESRSRWTSRPPSSAAAAAIGWRWRSGNSIPTALCERLVRWVERYPIVSIEDPLAEDDEARPGRVHPRRRATRVQVVGDDYLVTNAERVRAAARAGRLQLRADQAQPGRAR